MIIDFADAPIMIIGDQSNIWYTSYYLVDDSGIPRDFEFLDEQGRYFLKDKQSGSTWNVWGQAIDGSAKGARLKPTKNHNGYWYAFYAMYQDKLEVYVEDEDE